MGINPFISIELWLINGESATKSKFLLFKLRISTSVKSPFLWTYNKVNDLCIHHFQYPNTNFQGHILKLCLFSISGEITSLVSIQYTLIISTIHTCDADIKFV